MHGSNSKCINSHLNWVDSVFIGMNFSIISLCHCFVSHASNQKFFSAATKIQILRRLEFSAFLKKKNIKLLGELFTYFLRPFNSKTREEMILCYVFDIRLFAFHKLKIAHVVAFEIVLFEFFFLFWLGNECSRRISTWFGFCVLMNGEPS